MSAAKGSRRGALVLLWGLAVACADTGKLPFQDEGLLAAGGGLGGTGPNVVCQALPTLEACDTCCSGVHPEAAERWGELAHQCTCSSCYGLCGDVACVDQDLTQIPAECGDCAIACADAECEVAGCDAYSDCADPCMLLPRSTASTGTGGEGGWTEADAVEGCARVCAVAAAQGCTTAAACFDACLADLEGLCAAAMSEVVRCHDSLGLLCGEGLSTGSGIDPEPCSAQHRVAESCGIDPF